MSPQQIRINQDSTLRELIRLYNKNAYSGVFGVIAGSSLVTYFYVFNSSSSIIFGWFVFQVVMALTRLFLLQAYRKHKFSSDHSYLKAVYLNIILTGTGWSVFPFLFFGSVNQAGELFSLLVLGAVASGALASMSSLTRLGIVYISLTLLPAFYYFSIISADFPAEMVLGILIYYLFIVFTFLKISSLARQNIRDSIQSSHNEKIIRQLIDSSVDGIVSLDKNGRVLEWNQIAEELFSYSRGQAINRYIQTLIPVLENSDIFSDLEKFTDDELQRREIFGIHNRHGDPLTLEFILQPVNTGHEIFFSLNIHDISLQVEKNRAKEQEEKRARKLLNLVDTGIIEINLEGQISFINDSALKITGFRYDELIEHDFHQSLRTQLSAERERSWQESEIYTLLQGGLSKHLEDITFRHKNGQSLYVSLSVVPVYQNHQIVASLLSFSDETQSFRERQEKNRLMQISENSPDLMLTFSLDGRIFSANKAARDIFGITQQQLDQELFLRDIFTDKTHLQALLDEAVPCAFNNNYWSGETRLCSLYGTTLYFSQYVMKLQDDEDTQFFSLVMNDISELKQSEQNLIIARDDAEEAARAKSAFLATMSHEIRTPMNGVLGMAQLLADTPLDDEQKDYLTVINQSGQALMTIINDILDFSKIEAGHMSIEAIEFDLEKSVHEVCSLLSPKTYDKDVELILNVSAECPRLVRGDAGRIRQILMNLVGNALKFTDKGHVIIQIIPLELTTDQNVRLQFSVIDTGIGIEKDKQKKLFDSFTQADDSTTRKYGGTGLGLSISKQLVELMGGKLEVESEPGKGSRFFFTIELPVVEQRHYLNHQNLQNKRALVVDDHAINLQVLRKQLQHFGMQVFVTSKPLQAIEILQQASHRQQPIELVILDYMMPEINGADFGVQILHDDQIDDCPLVIYTSAATRGDAKRFHDLGFTGYLTKPTLSDLLHDTLECVLGEFEKNQGQPENIVTKYHVMEAREIDPQSVNLASLKVLLAEDNPVNQKVARSLLEKHNLDVLVANNGLEAVTLFKTQPFDVVLMDCQMPKMDGYAATQQIIEYQQQQQMDVPVIALTANAMEEDKKRCTESGMRGFLSKPFTADKLLQTIAQLLDLATDQNTAAKDHPPEPAENKLIEYATLDALKDAMAEDFVELIPAFIESTGQIIDAMHQALADQDRETMQRNAHSLKSSSASLGVMALSSLAKAIEAQCKQGQLAKENEVAQIEQVFQQTRQALHDYQSLL